MVLPALGIALSLAGTGAKIAAANQRGKAFERAAQTQYRSATDLAATNRRDRQFTEGRLRPFVGESNQITSDAVETFRGRPAFQAQAQPSAGILQAARDSLTQRFGSTPQVGSRDGSGVQLAIQDAIHQRTDPASRLRQSLLQEQMAMLPTAQAQSGLIDRQALMARQLGDIEADAALRQALRGEQFGAEQARFARQFDDATVAGGLANALGGLALQAGPMVAAAGGSGQQAPAGGGSQVQQAVARRLGQTQGVGGLTYGGVQQALPLYQPQPQAQPQPTGAASLGGHPRYGPVATPAFQGF